MKSRVKASRIKLSREYFDRRHRKYQEDWKTDITTKFYNFLSEIFIFRTIRWRRKRWVVSVAIIWILQK
jgi:hypothetical protein